MSNIESRLREREEARKAAVAARRLEKEKESRTEETSQYFTEQFTSKKKAIEDLLETAKSLPKDELPVHFDLISKECHTLQRLVSDATLYLAAFELKTTQEQISQLQALVNTSQDQLMPKKKFAFRSRPKMTASAKSSTNRTPPPSTFPENTVGTQRHVFGSGPPPTKEGERLAGFRDKENETLTLSSAEIHSHDVNLSDLRSCVVRLFGSPVTLHMSSMDNCCILCGPVSSSVFVDNCRNCTFVVACQQLRVHTTVDSVCYLHVTSKAIIEDCSRLQFTPYNLSYPELEGHFQESGLNRASNNWDQVDDFNWLAPTDPSPNWTVLPWEHRKTWD